MWSHILGMLVIVLLFFIGYSSDPRAYFFILVIAVAMINDVKKLGLEVGGRRWKILGKYLYLGVIVVGTAYVAFENIVHALLGLCGFLAGAGFVLFTPYGKAIKKYTVFQERNIALLVIIVSIVAILFTQLL